MQSTSKPRGARLLLAGLLLTGCHSLKNACDWSCLSQKVQDHVGQPLCAKQPLGCIAVPPEHALTEEEAVVLALWNNAAFQEQLTDLDLTRADLVQAGLLPNPELVTLFSVPHKPFRWLVDFPLESLWLRPVRLKIANRENQRACDRLTQVALDLMRDTRQGYADLLLARQRLHVAEEAVRIRGRVAELAEARLKAGDVSELEAATARIDALQARQDAIRITTETPVAEERLRNLLGLGDNRVSLQLEEAAPAMRDDLDVDALTAEAVTARPDVQAADWFAAAAQERVRFARLSWVRILGIADGTSGRVKGNELGPGIRVTLPVFNLNQGAVARAEAEWERAERARVTVHNQVIQDVRQAYARYTQARAELDLLRQKVKPEAEAAIRRAEKAYKEGSTSYLIVLESTRQLLDMLSREAQLQADLRRAWAELERSVGRRLAEK